MKNIFSEEEDLNIENFRVRINGYQFPDSDEYWDANWINVTCVYEGPSSFVKTEGPLIHLSELDALLAGLKRLYSRLEGLVEIDFMEPELYMSFDMKKNGEIDFVLRITPDHHSQKHEYAIAIDQSYLPGVIRQLEKIVSKMYKKDLVRE